MNISGRSKQLFDAQPSHGGGEVDLLLSTHGRRLGFDMKFAEAPKTTRSMHQVAEALELDHLFVVSPGERNFAASERISVPPVTAVPALPARVAAL